MIESISIPANNVSFNFFLLKDKRNKMTLILVGIAVLIQFSIFKYFYPFASYIHGDSFSYLRAAHQNLDINTYMIGYSRFLRLFSVFSKSDLVLTSFQYLLLQGSSLFALFTIFYFYKPGRIVQYLLLVFIVFNPLFWHLANLISSDGLFASLSMIWFALLLWIINRPSTHILIFELIVLFLAFTVRYNALIYPLITVVTIFFTSLTLKRKLAFISITLTVCSLFVAFTSNQYKQLTGIWQYSPFSGWQLANNSMYAYRYVDAKKRKNVDKRFTALDEMIRQYFDSTRDTKKYPTEAIMASSYYMWSPGMPLVKYKQLVFQRDSTATELKKWASMGPLLKDYGIHIIKKYPSHFLKYFVWPNSKKYYAPPVEFLQTYNSSSDSVLLIAKEWFGYKRNKVWTKTKDPEVVTLNFYPILSGIINVVMLCGIIFFSILKGFHKSNRLRSAIAVGGTIWLLNAAFTIFASSVALRFQSFPILTTTILSLLIIDWIRKMAYANEINNYTDTENNQLSSKLIPSVDL